MRCRTALFLLLAAAAATPQDGDLQSRAQRFLSLETRAFGHFQKEEWNEAIAAFEAQIATYDGNPRPYYNIACCYALQGDAERSATWLSLAITRGWRDAAWLAADTDFDKVRAGAPHQRCLAQLEEARARDPDPLPRLVDPGTVPAVESVRVLLTASLLQEQLLEGTRTLLGRHEYRKRLFHIYDRRMAMLSRYIIENGDARDAAEAASARVDTATRYLESVEEDNATEQRLQRVAAGYVVKTAEEFVRGYAGSTLLPQVQLLRANALRNVEDGRDRAEETLRRLLADFPEHEVAPLAHIQLCSLLADRGERDALRTAYEQLEQRWGADKAMEARMRGTLGKARLLAKGLPELALKRPKGLALYVFVAVDHADSEKRLETVHGFAAETNTPAVVVCVDPPQSATDEQRMAWLGKHARGLATEPYGNEIARDLWLNTLPLVVVARDREVLAVDPSDEELGRLIDG